MSVVFTINASLSDVIPMSPIVLSVDVIQKEMHCFKSTLVFSFLLYRQARTSRVSDLFFFSTSLNDVAPLASISVSVKVS